MNLINRIIRLIEQRMLRKLERYVSPLSDSTRPTAPWTFVKPHHQ